MSTHQQLERAVLEALSYSDIFNYPLKLDELARYLPIHLDGRDLIAAVARLDGLVVSRDGYLFLRGRDEIVNLRRKREMSSRRTLRHAMAYGYVLSHLPFVRMVAITGSLAVLNCDKTADLDFMLVTVPGRLWTARLFVLAFNRLTQMVGHTLCPNLIVSESALGWPQRDLYSARELCQMLLISGGAVYSRLLAVNSWVAEFLPNARPGSMATSLSGPPSRLQKFLEFPLCGEMGDRFERWEMDRKVARLSRQAGFGLETRFNAEVCQGNFNHHRTRTHEIYSKRLAELEARFPLSFASLPAARFQNARMEDS